MERITSPKPVGDEVEFERSLRPVRFEDFPGQVERAGDQAVAAAPERRRQAVLHRPPSLGMLL